MLPVFGTFINIYILILIYYVDRDRERERKKRYTRVVQYIYGGACTISDICLGVVYSINTYKYSI